MKLKIFFLYSFIFLFPFSLQNDINLKKERLLNSEVNQEEIIKNPNYISINNANNISQFVDPILIINDVYTNFNNSFVVNYTYSKGDELDFAKIEINEMDNLNVIATETLNIIPGQNREKTFSKRNAPKLSFSSNSEYNLFLYTTLGFQSTTFQYELTWDIPEIKNKTDEAIFYSFLSFGIVLMTYSITLVLYILISYLWKPKK